LIGPSAIFSEHVALPNIEAYISLSPKWEHALSCSPLGPPLQLRYMKLNQDQTIWIKNEVLFGNILGSTMGTWGTHWEETKDKPQHP